MQTQRKLEAPEPATAEVTRFPLARLTMRRRAAIRLKELKRLSRFLIDHQLVTCSRYDWLWVLGSTLACFDRRERQSHPSDRRGVGLSAWPGLDFFSLKEAAAEAGFHFCPDDEVERAMDDVLRHKASKGARLLPYAWLGEKVQLTAAVREACEIRSIDACDETREQRAARVKQRRRERDKEAKRQKRAVRAVHPSRTMPLSQRKPWEAQGISRRTWYYRRKAKILSSESDLALPDSHSAARQRRERAELARPAQPRLATATKVLCTRASPHHEKKNSVRRQNLCNGVVQEESDNHSETGLSRAQKWRRDEEGIESRGVLLALSRVDDETQILVDISAEPGGHRGLIHWGGSHADKRDDCRQIHDGAGR